MTVAIVQQWLATQCSLIRGVRSGIVVGAWHDGPAGHVVRWPTHSAAADSALKAAEAALRHGKPVMRVGMDEAPGAQSPVVVAAPLHLEAGKPARAAAALLLERGDAEQGKTVLELLHKGAPWLRELLLQGATAQPRASTPALELATHLLATALGQPRFQAAATAVVTELATHLHCDRVALGIREGQRMRLVAVSHNTEVRARQDLALALTGAMDEAVDQQATLRYPVAEDTAAPPRITLAHRELWQRFHTGEQCTVPLFHDGDPVGALWFERTAGKPFKADTVALCEHCASLLAPVLQLKWRNDQPWWRRWRNRLARLAARVRDRREKALRYGLLTAVGTITFLAAYPVGFHVSAPARVEGSIQRTLTVPNDGFIKQVHVRPGDSVRAGQVLVELEDNDLLLEQRKLRGEIAQFETTYGSALAAKDRTQLAVTVAKLEEAKARLALIEQQLHRVQIRAPFDGVLIQGDLTQSLGAPVKQGDALMVLAPAGDYRVIVSVDERDVAFIAVDQHGTLALSASPNERIPIRIERITPMAEVRDGANVFEAEARLSNADARHLRPGLQGIAKIQAGAKPWLWVTTRQLRRWIAFEWWARFGGP